MEALYKEVIMRDIKSFPQEGKVIFTPVADNTMDRIPVTRIVRLCVEAFSDSFAHPELDEPFYFCEYEIEYYLYNSKKENTYFILYSVSNTAK